MDGAEAMVPAVGKAKSFSPVSVLNAWRVVSTATKPTLPAVVIGAHTQAGSWRSQSTVPSDGFIAIRREVVPWPLELFEGSLPGALLVPLFPTAMSRLPS